MGTGRKGPKFKLGSKAGRKARAEQDKEDSKRAKQLHEASLKALGLM